MTLTFERLEAGFYVYDEKGTHRYIYIEHLGHQWVVTFIDGDKKARYFHNTYKQAKDFAELFYNDFPVE